MKPLRIGLSLVCAALFATSASASEETDLKKGKTIFRLEKVEGSPRSKVISRGVIEASLENVFQTVTDYGHYAEFMPRMTKSEILERFEGGLRFYSYLDMPWPISDVSYECRIRFGPDHTSLDFELVPGTGKGVESFSGNWKFGAFEGDSRRTLTEYSLFYEPDRWYPNWAMNLGVKHTIAEIMDAMRKRLKETKSAP